eukprot:gene32411-39193_t
MRGFTLSNRVHAVLILLEYLVLLASSTEAASISLPAKTYTCMSNGKCRLNNPLEPSPTDQSLSQSVCLATCGKGTLWPYPTGGVTLGQTVHLFSSADEMVVQLENQDNAEESFNKLFRRMEVNFRAEINKLEKMNKADSNVAADRVQETVRVVIRVTDHTITKASPLNDESYSLQTSYGNGYVEVVIQAETLFGARHGLETLSQLIVYDNLQKKLAIVLDVKVQDEPRFQYRGTMIDISRHFISMDKLKENVRAMGYNKMNVFHIHLSDTASVPVTFPSQPNITAYGAYDEDKLFSVHDLQDLVQYAAGYGVMILPEIDAPAHMAAGWQWGPSAGLGDLVLCADPYGAGGTQWDSDALEPASGQLNIVNPNAMKVLDTVYSDVIDQIPSPFFHIGGDEVIVGSDSTSIACYNSSSRGKAIIDYLESVGLPRDQSSSFYSLWENFTMQATDLVQSNYKNKNIQLSKLHIWGGGGVDSSGQTYNLLTQSNLVDFLPPSMFNIQVWDTAKHSISADLIRKGYSVVLSNTDYVYLDCGNAGWTNAG